MLELDSRRLWWIMMPSADNLLSILATTNEIGRKVEVYYKNISVYEFYGCVKTFDDLINVIDETAHVNNLRTTDTLLSIIVDGQEHEGDDYYYGGGRSSLSISSSSGDDDNSVGADSDTSGDISGD